MNLVKILQENGIPLRKAKNNPNVYLANKCIFCSTNSNRVFRLNTKLKVGKCYACGEGFKCYTFLLKLIKNRDNLYLYHLENTTKHWLGVESVQKKKEYIEWFKNTEKLRVNNSEKSEGGDDLPF